MEIEIKFKLDNPLKLEKKIRSLGAKFLGKIKEYDIYFDNKQKSLTEEKKVLRLRHTDKKAYLTFKKSSEDPLRYKNMHEFEVEINSFSKALLILNGLGFKEVFRKQKERVVYKLGGCFLLIDKLPKIGYYLEIESTSERKITSIVKKIGLEDKESTILSYREILKNYAKKR